MQSNNDAQLGHFLAEQGVYRLKNFLHSIFRPVIVELFVWAHNSCLRAIVYAPPSILHFSIPSTRNSGFHAFPFVEQHFIHASSSSRSWYMHDRRIIFRFSRFFYARIVQRRAFWLIFFYQRSVFARWEFFFKSTNL